MARSRSRTRAYGGVRVSPSGVHPYVGVRSGCLSCSCVVLLLVMVGVPGLVGAAVAVWH